MVVNRNVPNVDLSGLSAEQAFRWWQENYGLQCHIPITGYQETEIGISIILANKTAIPFPYRYDDYFHPNILKGVNE